MQYLIGVDIGTQGTKAAMFDENCQAVAESFVPSNLLFPEKDAVEQDPGELYSSCTQAIARLMEQSNVPKADVAGLALGGQMAGIMGIGARGEAVTPYDSWLDMRCGAYRQKFLDYGEEEVIRLTGAPVTYAHGPKILWWQAERPEIYKRIARFVPPAPYCAMRLCGLGAEQAFTDKTYLHFYGFSDTKNKAWSKELTHGLGVSEGMFPRILEPGELVGALTKEAAQSCGLLEGTRVAAGCGDTAASLFGAGVVRKGEAFDVAGTASAFATAVDVYEPDTLNKTIMFAPAVVDGLYAPMAYIGGGGMCLKWLRDDVLAGAVDYKVLDEEAMGVPPGSEGLLFCPHFSGRTCPNETGIRGSYVGLSWMHKRAHLFRAVMESIAYEYKLYQSIIASLTRQHFSRVITVGGGAKSALFRSIKADVLGAPVTTINRSDTGVLGLAIIAGHGVGLFKELTAPLKTAIQALDTTRPDERTHKAYEKYANAYANAFSHLREIQALL